MFVGDWKNRRNWKDNRGGIDESIPGLTPFLAQPREDHGALAGQVLALDE